MLITKMNYDTRNGICKHSTGTKVTRKKVNDRHLRSLHLNKNETMVQLPGKWDKF